MKNSPGQYFAARGDTDAVRILADYVITRHFPDIETPAAAADSIIHRIRGELAR